MIFIVGFTNTLQVQELITGFIVEQLKRIKIIVMMEEEQTLPTLIPIGRRKKQTLFLQSKEDKSKGTSQKQPSKSPLEDIKKSTQQRDKQQAILAERMHTPKIQEFDNRFQMMNEKVLSKEERQKKQGKAETTDKFKEIENSKALINEILHKINAKNVSEELYPVTNETIEQLKRSLEDQIAELKYEADRKENSLHSNPNNQHLKKQLQAIKKSIDRSTTIKQLYNQKINLRNKIMILQNSMLSLREENVNLKIKISKGIETIQNHMHHLPCEQEKELKIELNKSMNDYKKEKEMREKLEANISQIVLNFKRLYQEAETARLIVTHKLKELQSREKQLLTGAKEAELAEATKDKEEKMVSEANSMKPNALDVRTRRQNQQAKNITLPSQHSTKTPQKRPVFQPSSQTDRTKAKANTSQPLFSLQEQIKRMRANQNTMITLQKR